ncbi:MAG: mechanosensitive ion channel family protein [Terrimicrobiaceae bacterium]|nr:mechanosensitive ion channel family protein [Terrimicrobiaceae bacterium]
MFPFLAQAAAESDLIEEGLRYTNLTLLYFGSAILIYLVLLFGGRLIKRRFGLPLGWAYHLFSIAVGLFVPTRFRGIEVVNADVENKTFAAAVAITGTLVVIGFIRHYCYDRFRDADSAQVPKFLSQFLSAVVGLAAILILLDSVYKVPVTGLLAGAGIAGIVLGLALQDTLGNIFSGFAIYFGGQFKAGDWLLVDDHHAQIIEINWRSTRLRTNDDVYLDIPNSQITKQTVINYSYPTGLHAVRMDIGLHYDAPPTLVKRVLIEAAGNCRHVVPEPAPDVFLTAFGDWAITYQLRFWLTDHLNYDAANDEIRTNLWYALKRHGIAIPYPIQHEMSLEPPAPIPCEAGRIREALGRTLIGPCLTPEQVDVLAAGARIVEFGSGETIIRQNAPAGAMYVLISGRAQVFLENAAGRMAVAVLDEGACIGENSVLTGDPRSATVVASEDCTAVEVAKSTLAPIIGASPELLEILSDLLAKRRLQNEGIVAESGAAADSGKRQNYREGFLEKLRTFFEV